MHRFPPILALLAALVLVACGDRASQAVQTVAAQAGTATTPTLEQRPTVTLPTIPERSSTTSTTTRTTATVTPPVTATLRVEQTISTGPAAASDASDGDASTLLVVAIIATALLIVVALGSWLWRRSHGPSREWRQRLDAVLRISRWSATDLPAAVLDPRRTPDEAERAWRAQRLEVDRAIEELEQLSGAAGRAIDGDHTTALAGALDALRQSLDAYVRAAPSGAASTESDLVRLHARDVLTAVERAAS